MRTLLITILSLITLLLATVSQAAVAIFAGGCFWCMQADFDKIPGVEKTIVGYIGGKAKNPTYKQVSSGRTGYVEAMKVTYNSKLTNYQKMLNVFWKNVDPTDAGGQFCDRGFQYTSGIFYLNKKQKTLALSSKKKIIKSKRFAQVATRIVPASKFYPAEKYHQNYYKKNPLRYKFYRSSCGRDSRLNKVWNS